MKLIDISIRAQLSFPNLMMGYNTYRWRNMTILYNAMVELSLILFSVRIEVGKSGIMGFQKVYLTPTIVLERTPKITIDKNVVTMHNEMDGYLLKLKWFKRWWWLFSKHGLTPEEIDYLDKNHKTIKVKT